MSPRWEIATSTNHGLPRAKSTLTQPCPHPILPHGDGYQQTPRSLPETKRPSPRRSTRLQTRQHLNTPSSPASLQEPFNGHQDLVSSVNEQSHHAENARPRKRSRTGLQSVSERSLPLTKHNLQKHNTLLMDSEADSSGGRRPSKRSASRTQSDFIQSPSTVTQETASGRSQKSSGTSAHYRYTILSKARIYIHHMPTPDEIRAQIDAVIQREVSSERKEKLSSITQQLNDSFIRVVTFALGEDDCIEPLYHALSSMDHSESLTFARKAGMVTLLLSLHTFMLTSSLDWRINLKPRMQPPYWDLGFRNKLQNKAGDSEGQASKRQQQGDTSYLSPVASGSNATGGINSKEKVCYLSSQEL